MDFLAGPNSPVAKYTPKGRDADSVFDVRAILQQLHLELDWAQMHDFLKPRTGPLGLIDYEKVFCPVADKTGTSSTCAASTAARARSSWSDPTSTSR